MNLETKTSLQAAGDQISNPQLNWQLGIVRDAIDWWQSNFFQLLEQYAASIQTALLTPHSALYIRTIRGEPKTVETALSENEETNF